MTLVLGFVVEFVKNLVSLWSVLENVGDFHVMPVNVSIAVRILCDVSVEIPVCSFVVEDSSPVDTECHSKWVYGFRSKDEGRGGHSVLKVQIDHRC